MPHLEGRSVVIFGSGGRIGSAAVGVLKETGWRVETVSWLDKSTGAARPWHEILAELASIEGDVDIVFASGLTDPSASAGDLMLANVERPIGLIGATIDQKQIPLPDDRLGAGDVLEPCHDQSLPRLEGRALGAHRGACGRSAPPWTDCAPACTHRLRRRAHTPFVPGADARKPAREATFPNE